MKSFSLDQQSKIQLYPLTEDKVRCCLYLNEQQIMNDNNLLFEYDYKEILTTTKWIEESGILNSPEKFLDYDDSIPTLQERVNALETAFLSLLSENKR